MRKRALITGITGQDGSYLAELLLEKGYQVFGMVRRSSTENFERIEHLRGRIELRRADLLDQSSLMHLLKEVRPYEVYNLAAQSFVPTSWEQPVLTAEFTALGVTRLLEAIRHVDPEIRFYQASSSEMFGRAQEVPQNERTPFYPRSPYGVAKCLTPRAKIYTDKGLKSIKHIEIGDKVWTHTGQLRKVTNIFRRKYSGELINITVSSSTGRKTNSVPQMNFQLTLTPEHPVLTDRGWVWSADLKEGDLVAVVASRCRHCGEKIPANREYCSKGCQRQYAWVSNEEFRNRITEITKRRFKENDYWHTPEAIRNRNTAVANRLQREGMNHMEYYINLLIQDCSPGFFQFVGDGRVCIDGYFPDWINEHKKAIIEFVAWGENLARRQEQFRKKIETLENAGYKVLVIKGSEFKRPELIKEKVSKFVSDLGSLEFVYVPILSIKKYEHKNNNYVYNIEVEEDESYVANGIVVHNCYGHWITVNYRESYGLFACSGICFNHTSPRRGKEFVSRKVTDRAARIKLGLESKLLLGNLDAKRDWGFAKDYCEAMWLMLQQDHPDDYVIATGETHSVRELVEIAFSYVGLDWQEHVVIDPALIRPAEVDFLVGDASKARRKLGWRPRVSFRELIEMMVDADLTRLQGVKSKG